MILVSTIKYVGSESNQIDKLNPETSGDHQAQHIAEVTENGNSNEEHVKQESSAETRHNISLSKRDICILQNCPREYMPYDVTRRNICRFSHLATSQVSTGQFASVI